MIIFEMIYETDAGNEMEKRTNFCIQITNEKAAFKKRKREKKKKKDLKIGSSKIKIILK